MAAVTICSDFEAPKIKSVTISTVSPSICHEVIPWSDYVYGGLFMGISCYSCVYVCVCVCVCVLKVSFKLLVHFISFQVFLIAEFESTFCVIFISFFIMCSLSLSLLCIGEGNGNPLQCSCLENPRDGRAWWAAVYGVTQSRTRLKRLSSSSSSSLCK